MKRLSESKTIEGIVGFLKLIRKRLRLVKINRNLLVYLVFLLISIGFWCLQTLKQSSVQTMALKLEITDVPKNIIFTSAIPDSLKLTVEGRGFEFLRFSANGENVIRISYDNLPKKNGKISVDANYLRRAVQKKLGSALALQSCSPSTLECYYSAGLKKRVPVFFGGKVQVGLQHVLCDIRIEPEYIDVYAPVDIISTIGAVYTKAVTYTNLTDTVEYKVALDKQEGVKLVPDSVTIKICVDLFTEKHLSVPIYCENIPENKVLRTFPIKADVSFHVSAAQYDNITEKDFLIVVDYNSINKGDEKCKLQLRSQPAGVSHVTVSPQNVEYVIEQAD